jgi:poly(3-hydroxybutyrate) depolymerase
MTARHAALTLLLVCACLGAGRDPVQGLRDWLARAAAERADLATQPFADEPLTKGQAARVRQLLWQDHVATVRATRQTEWDAQSITVGDKTLKWKQKQFGTKPKDGWDLFISMHGGGGAPARVNDQQWENQVRLYQPENSLYIAPRAPTDNWNLWHEPHIDVLFDRLIQDAIVLGEVNPDRVYIMGYSAGGDGVYQLAPRMADRLAAASMMAGHPNDASPLGLRNIGFTIHVGANDGGYRRNEVAREWAKKLDGLAKADPGGYVHEVRLHEGRGHWMNLEDKVAVAWMAKFTRDPLPEKVVWNQGAVTHDRFYWLAMPHGQAGAGQLVVASRHGQEVRVEKAEGVRSLTVRFSDAMLDMDREIRVAAAGRERFRGKVARTVRTILKTLDECGDPFLVFDGAVDVALQ